MKTSRKYAQDFKRKAVKLANTVGVTLKQNGEELIVSAGLKLNTSHYRLNIVR